MISPAPREIARQYRVAKPTLAMHADLRDRYAALGLAAEIILLVFAVIVTATTFAGTEFYTRLRVPSAVGWLAQGTLAVFAFGGSLILLIVDPRGKSAIHADAAAKWWPVVDRFRRCRQEDNSWREEDLGDLAHAYGAACELAAPIPDAHFNRLKSRYLRKVEVSSFKNRYPGCPLIVLHLCIFVRDTIRAISEFRRGGGDADKDVTHD